MRGSEQGTGPGGPRARAEAVARLCEVVRHSRLPVAVVRLADGETLEVSDPFADVLGVDREGLLGRPSADFTVDGEAARTALGLLAAGTLDAYTRRAWSRRPGGEPFEVELRVTCCRGDASEEIALVSVLPVGHTPALPTTAPDPGPPVLGTLDPSGHIHQVGSDETGLLPLPPRDMVGRSLLAGIHPEDTGRVLLLAADSLSREGSASQPVRLRNRDGAWELGHVALQPLTKQAPRSAQAGFAFALSRRPGTAPADVPADVTTGAPVELTAGPVWLAGLPTLGLAPELSRLTPREREIVVRLAGGQRVPAIARELYLSQSTVRNHLTAVFRTFGVRSQGELLDRLRRQVARP